MCLGNRVLFSPGYFFLTSNSYLSLCANRNVTFFFSFVTVLCPPRRLGFFLSNTHVDIVMTVRKDVAYAKGRNRSDYIYIIPDRSSFFYS